jgi:quaternary ammonium compound-resistance protein SugE
MMKATMRALLFEECRKTRNPDFGTMEVFKMQWIILLLAGLFEIGWAITMKYSNGFTVLLPSVITAVGYIASAVFLSLALRHLPLGTAYAMWTGMGIVGTSILGVFLFQEKLSVPQVICIILILVGIIGLKLLAKE